MQILRLSVAGFAGIDRAEIELGPGLNVLYGPNDTGKSTLAEAIAAALLLSPTAALGEGFVPWDQGERVPSVSLVFRTEPRKVWRVTKTFHPSRGTARLELSHDAETFTQEHTGRRVDDEVRKLLAWGIPGPGGAGGPRGMPESFLATALLARQGDVDEVLRASLEADRDPSGKERIVRALQALAQHPLVARCLRAAQQKVDEAFTSTGRTRRGKGAPLAVLQDDVRQAEDAIDECRRLAEESAGARRSVVNLTEERLRRLARRQQREEDVRALEALRAAAEARADAEACRDAARTELARVDGVVRAVGEAEGALAAAGEALAARESAVAAAQTDVTAADGALGTARERLRDLASEAGAQRLAARRNALEAERLAAEGREREAAARRERADAAAKLVSRTKEIEKAVADAATALRAQGERAQAAGERERRAREALDEARGLVALVALREAEAALRKAETDAGEAERLRKESEAKRAEAAAIEAELAARPLPDRKALEALRTLDQDLRVAAGKLEVGLAVEVRAKRALDLGVARDGGAVEPHALAPASPGVFEAKREVRLDLDVAEVLVRGGDAAARTREQDLRERFRREAEPVLKAAGAKDVRALERLCEAAATRATEARERRGEADGLARQARALGDVGAAVETRRRAVEAATEALGGRERGLLEASAAAHGERLAAAVPRLVRQEEDALERATKERGRLDVEIARARATADGQAAELERVRTELASAVAALGSGDAGAARAAAGEARDAARADKERLATEIRKLQDDATASTSEAEAAVRAAEAALARAHEALAKARREREDTLAQKGKLEGQLAERRRAAATEDPEAARRVVAEAESALGAAPAPERTPADGEMDAACEALREAQQAVAEVERDLNQAEGALSQVGGAVAEERHEQAKLQLEAAHGALRDKEADYAAWQLLAATLRDVERAQATHLGRLLAEPIARSFRELTADRYDGLALGPHLDAAGIVAAGAERPIDRLSVGTREQLATLFRLALARQVGSALLLDDQLVQSDERRMAWFARLLREAAPPIQVLVLTCRSADYLAPAEHAPATGACFADSDDGRVRAIDLARVVVRAVAPRAAPDLTPTATAPGGD